MALILCNFGRVHFKEQVYEIILFLDKWFTWRCHLKIFLISGFYIKLNVWGSLGLNFEYDGGPIIEIVGPIFLYKLRILEGSISFLEGSV